MHFATMVHHAARSRTKSVQFEKSLLSFDTTDGASSRDGTTSPLVPGTRTSSLPVGENKENINTIRHYRSMLDVDGAPKLPLAKPLSYDELYPKPAEPIELPKPVPRRPCDS